MNALNPRSVAHALGGESRGNRVSAPGPGHSPNDRSLSIWIDPGYPEGFLVSDFAGGDWAVARDHVRRMVGLPAFGERRESPPGEKAEFRRRREAAEWSESERRREMQRRALALWDEAQPLAGSIGERYLITRLGGKDIPEEVLAGDALRFHPSCPYQQDRRPCIVGLFTDTITGTPRAIHRTAMTPAGEKIGRMSLGPIGGCVVRLWPDEAVEQGLVIGEGVETTLAAATRIEHRGTLLQPAWAAGSSGTLENFPVLGGIGALTILVDHDVSGTGQRAAETCAHRWKNAGRQVIRLVPKQLGADFADIVMEVAEA